MALSSCLDQYRSELLSAARIFVAYSGGMDSHVLLHLVVRWFKGLELQGQELQDSESAVLPPLAAVHINHHLSPFADRWQSHCMDQASGLEVPCLTFSVEVDRTQSSVEQAARHARYGVFEELLEPEDLLLMAHHGDDQAETVLYRLLRGSGAQGLAGIPVFRPLGQGMLLRPLLSVARSALNTYGRSHQLNWVEDESNADMRFDRNYIRQQILPQLAKRWPDYVSRIQTSGARCQDASDINQSVASEDMLSVAERQERLGWSISLCSLSLLSPLRQNNLLRHWVNGHGIDAPNKQVLDTLQNCLIDAKSDAMPIVPIPTRCDGMVRQAEFRRFNGRLYLLPAGHIAQQQMNSVNTADAQQKLFIDGEKALLQSQSISLFNGSSLLLEQGQGVCALQRDRLDSGTVTVSFRQGGERCHPAGRSAANSLKKLFQEYGLEPWLRSLVPLIYDSGELMAVAGLWVCEGYQAEPGSTGLVIDWVPDGGQKYSAGVSG